mgnify:FL=1
MVLLEFRTGFLHELNLFCGGYEPVKLTSEYVIILYDIHSFCVFDVCSIYSSAVLGIELWLKHLTIQNLYWQSALVDCHFYATCKDVDATIPLIIVKLDTIAHAMIIPLDVLDHVQCFSSLAMIWWEPDDGRTLYSLYLLFLHEFLKNKRI